MTMQTKLKSAIGVVLAGLLASGSAVAYTALDTSEFDTKADPCVDLNAYANAKWIAANPVPADQTRWNTFQVLRERSLDAQHEIAEEAAKHTGGEAITVEQQVGRYYHAGMDEAAIVKAGTAPIANDLGRVDRMKSAADIVTYLHEAYLRGENPVFAFTNSADYQDATQQIAYARQAGLSLPTSEYYTKPEHAEIREAYVAHIGKMLELAGVEKAAAAAQAQQAMAVETRLAKASLPPVQLRDPVNQYHFVSIDEADKATPHFSWKAFFKSQGVDAGKGFSLSQPAFFVEMDKMLAETPVAEWQAYLRYHVIENAAPYLAPAFEQESFEFFGRTLSGQKEMKPRWKRVVLSLNDDIGMAMGELYVKRHFTREAKQRMDVLVSNLRQALHARIEKLPWMSAETKVKALEKWDTFLPKVGYPDTWRDWSGLKIGADDSYYSIAQAAAKYNRDWRYAKIGKPTDRLEWTMTPQTVNAYYRPTDNTINFPAAILQPPFFDAKADDAVNYGGIGAVIGHEITHGYDDQGSKFDAKGNNANWWTKEDREKFDERTAKLAAQFDGYEPLPGQHVNGKLTLGENIADLGGLTIAYDALHLATAKSKPAKIDGYTAEQRFFLAWARIWRGGSRPEALKVRLASDPHSPEAYRAIGAPSNMEAYADAFQCKGSAAMLRRGAIQVTIW